MIKKIHIKIILIIAFLLLFNTIPVFSYTIPGVRIGLEYKHKNTASIPIQNTEIVVGYENNGYFTPCAELIQGPFTASATDAYYVRIPYQFLNYEQAAQYALSYTGYNSVVGLRGPGEFYLYLGSYSSQQEALNTAGITGGTVVSLILRGTLISASGRAVLLFDNDTLFPQVKSVSAGGFVNLGDRQYRGAIELNRTSGTSGRLTAVNVCSIDEYLYSVVPSEMPSSWHIEALKAQAVASRCYVLTRLHAHLSSGYNFCDSGHCQVYQGTSAEKEETLLAIFETSGVLAMYNDEPINAVFFSSSGGQTDNSENVWNDYLPYLRSVNGFDDTNSKIWARTFTMTEITGILNAKNVNIGNATGVTINASPVTGRVSELTIQGTGGSVSYEKEEIRTFFSSTSGGLLESRNFTITDGVVSAGTSTSNPVSTSDSVVYVVGASSSTNTQLTNTFVYSGGMSMPSDQNLSIVSINGIAQYTGSNSGSNIGSNTDITGTTITGGYTGQVTFSGRGFGHGVGMSQYGAKTLAESGYSFIDILRHYYTGVYFSDGLH